MSALGQKRTSRSVEAMSALPPKADIGTHAPNVRFVPKADICSAAKSVAFNTPDAGKRHELFFAPFALEKRAGGPGLNWRTWNRAVGAENTTCSLLRPQSLNAARTFVGDQARIHRHP